MGKSKAGKEERLSPGVGLQLQLDGQGRPHSDGNIGAKILENHKIRDPTRCQEWFVNGYRHLDIPV